MQRQPLLAKAVPTAVGFCFGDFLTQYFNRDVQVQYRHDFSKTAQMALVGASVAAPIGLGLLRVLDISLFSCNPHTAFALSSKFLLDQVLGCLIWQAAYISISESYRRGALSLLARVTAPAVLPAVVPLHVRPAVVLH
jgi:hypothetical protein